MTGKEALTLSTFLTSFSPLHCLFLAQHLKNLQTLHGKGKICTLLLLLFVSSWHLIPSYLKLLVSRVL